MSYRRYPNARGYRPYDSGGYDRINQQSNDDELRKALRYLTKYGYPDETDTYINRVQAIDKHILQLYLEEGRLFDHQLYQQVQSLVDKVQGDVESVDAEESSLGFDSDSIEEEIRSPEALYRQREPPVDDFESLYNSELDAKTPTKEDQLERHPAGPRKQVRFSPKEGNIISRDNDARERHFLYGGPDNDPETWFQETPAILPFGENPFMEKWESMKINYDLTESTKKSADDAKPVTTNVPYDAVKRSDGFVRPNSYNSGSRYKLPSDITKPQVPWTNLQTKKLVDTIDEFNEGGLENARKEKDYVPRTALPTINEFDPSTLKFIRLTGTSTARAPSRRSGRPQKVKKPVRKTVRMTQQTPAPHLPPPALKNLDSARKTARERSGKGVARRRNIVGGEIRPIKRSKAANFSTPTPKSNVDPSTKPAKRKPGRPRKVQDPTYYPSRQPETPSPVDLPEFTPDDDLEQLATTAQPKRTHIHHHKAPADPTYRPGLSPISPGKRQRDENLDDEKLAKKPKVARKSTRGALRHVNWPIKSDEDDPPTRKATPKKGARPKKSGIKKTTRTSLEDRELAKNQTATRGSTRSGNLFKPANLRRSI